MANIERAIQKAVIYWVKKNHPSLIITGTDNENNYKDVGSIGSLGITDLLLFHPKGQILFCELKTKTGKLKPSQITFNEFFDTYFAPTQNYTRAVAQGYNAALEIISNWIKEVEK